MKTILILILICTHCLLIGNGTIVEVNHIIDLQHLSKNGDDWSVDNVQRAGNSTAVTLHADKWLMYFLHWRPLTDHNRNLSIEYVKKLLLSFWGPDMPFKIVGHGGKTTAGGHPAFFIDGTIYNNKIRTRFIVWNCPQTGRQFISDCNINKSLGTHKKFLSTQFDITSTIACHSNKIENNHPGLSKHYHSQEFNLSFFTPPLWRTQTFQSKKWFPQGMSRTNGTLWTLVTDSEKIIYWVTTESHAGISMALLRDRILGLKGKTIPSGIAGVKARIIQADLTSPRKEGNQVWGMGRLTAQFEYQKKKYDTQYLFKAGLWNKAKGNFLLCAFAVRKEVWKQPFDLTPEKTGLESFIKYEVLPALKNN